MIIKTLIRQKNLAFYKSYYVSSATTDECDMIIKSSGYYRHLPVFKSMYNLIYKSKKLSLAQYKQEVAVVKSYLSTHPDDYIISGLCSAMSKSSMSNSSKKLFGIMVYKQIFKKGRMFNSFIDDNQKHLCKSVTDYYDMDKDINAVIICKSTNVLFKVDNTNVLKYMFFKQWNI